MLDSTIPSSLAAVLLSFAPCFTQPGFVNFAALLSGWILCPGRHSVSRVVQAALGPGRRKHHSTLYRFLSRGRWCTDALGHALFLLLLPWLPEEITAIVDDTLCHRSGPHLFGAAMHHDAARSTYGRGTAAGRKVVFSYGHNWVVLALWVPLPWAGPDGGLALPVLFHLYRSKKRCPEGLYRKRTHLARELLSLLALWLPPGRRILLVADSEYSCHTLLSDLPPTVNFAGPLPMDAALYEEPGPYRGRGRRPRKGSRLPTPRAFANAKDLPWTPLDLRLYGQDVHILVKSWECLWYTVTGTRRVRVVLTRDPRGRLQDRAFLCTDVDRAPKAILQGFSRRWSLEVAFRNGKQALGVEDPQNGWGRGRRGRKRPGPQPRGRKGETAVRHTLPLAFAAYAIVVLWYLRHGKRRSDVARVRREAPWYRHKKAPSFNDMLGAVRRELWAARLSQDPLPRRILRNAAALLPHWLLAA